ncbi:MAG: ABC transporter ATP-binding protein [Chloroflexi bacterium]|nr:MAG: ABC transporter ATP-binding protein [Chloroflexota bacterium]
MANNNVVIKSRGLTKKYGDFTAVDHLNLTVNRGEVFGLLGPNGSGKTTTILMLLGLTEPTAGSVEVLGLDPARQPLSVKARVGYLPDQVGFYDGLTARENLGYIARLNGLPRAEANERIQRVLSQVGLSEVANKRVGTFSRGMRQRLGVAEVLLKQPELIIMDEPTLGLDPEGAREFLELIVQLKSEGITMLLSSHLLHQVQAVCDRVGLFHRGQMVLEGTVPELAQKVLGGAYRILVEANGTGNLEEVFRRINGVVNINRAGQDRYELEAKKDLRPEVARSIVEAGGKLLSLNIELPSLDEVYARYFKKEVDHVGAVA